MGRQCVLAQGTPRILVRVDLAGVEFELIILECHEVRTVEPLRSADDGIRNGA